MQNTIKETTFTKSYDTIDLILFRAGALNDLLEHCASPDRLNENTLGFTAEMIRELIAEAQDLLKAAYDAERNSD